MSSSVATLQLQACSEKAWTQLLKGQAIVLSPRQPEHAGMLLSMGSAKTPFALKTIRGPMGSFPPTVQIPHCITGLDSGCPIG